MVQGWFSWVFDGPGLWIFTGFSNSPSKNVVFHWFWGMAPIKTLKNFRGFDGFGAKVVKNVEHFQKNKKNQSFETLHGWLASWLDGGLTGGV